MNIDDELPLDQAASPCSAWRNDTKKPITVIMGAVTDSGSTKVSSGVATTPAPKPATPRTA